VRLQKRWADAGKRLPVLLWLQELRRSPEAARGRLLRLLLLWLGALSAHAERTRLWL